MDTPKVFPSSPIIPSGEPPVKKGRAESGESRVHLDVNVNVRQDRGPGEPALVRPCEDCSDRGLDGESLTVYSVLSKMHREAMANKKRQLKEKDDALKILQDKLDLEEKKNGLLEWKLRTTEGKLKGTELAAKELMKEVESLEEKLDKANERNGRLELELRKLSGRGEGAREVKNRRPSRSSTSASLGERRKRVGVPSSSSSTTSTVCSDPDEDEDASDDDEEVEMDSGSEAGSSISSLGSSVLSTGGSSGAESLTVPKHARRPRQSQEQARGRNRKRGGKMVRDRDQSFGDDEPMTSNKVGSESEIEEEDEWVPADIVNRRDGVIWTRKRKRQSGYSRYWTRNRAPRESPPRGEPASGRKRNRKNHN